MGSIPGLGTKSQPAMRSSQKIKKKKRKKSVFKLPEQKGDRDAGICSSVAHVGIVVVQLLSHVQLGHLMGCSSLVFI